MESSSQTTGEPGYPVRFSVEYPDRPLNRLTTGFWVFVAIPILIVAASIGGHEGTFAAGEHGWRIAGGTGGLLLLPPLLMILFRQKYPRWWKPTTRVLRPLLPRRGCLPTRCQCRAALGGRAFSLRRERRCASSQRIARTLATDPTTHRRCHHSREHRRDPQRHGRSSAPNTNHASDPLRRLQDLRPRRVGGADQQLQARTEFLYPQARAADAEAKTKGLPRGASEDAVVDAAGAALATALFAARAARGLSPSGAMRELRLLALA
jgi:hypothetical protein